MHGGGGGEGGGNIKQKTLPSAPVAEGVPRIIPNSSSAAGRLPPLEQAPIAAVYEATSGWTLATPISAKRSKACGDLWFAGRVGAERRWWSDEESYGGGDKLFSGEGEGRTHDG